MTAQAGRIAMWVLAIVVFGVLLARVESIANQVRHEGEVREDQLCGVVINVHDNAKFRLRTEQQQLHSTLDYLRSGDADETPALKRRVKQGVPVQRDRIKVAHENVVATKPPPVCK